MKNFFSIILPTRNRANQLYQCLQTLKHQTHKAFEVIVIDDASTDGTKKWAELWLKRLEVPYAYLRNDTNKGTGASYARGLACARGSHICLFSDDDEYMPHHLELANDFINANPDVAWSTSDSFILYEDTCGVGLHCHIASRFLPKDVLSSFTQGKFPFNGNIVYNRNIMEQVGGIRPLYYVEDFDLWLRLLKAGHPLHVRKGIPSYIYTDHKGKHIADPGRREADLEFALSDFCKTVKDSTLKSIANQYLLKVRIRNKVKAFLRALGVRK